MKGLKVDNEQDWEDLSRFLAQNFYKENHRKDAEFLKYGSRGQDQHGIDLISKQADFVVQCKNVQKLEWEDILIELNKTNNYPRENICIQPVQYTKPVECNSVLLPPFC